MVLQAQKDTWASVYHDNVDHVFLYAKDVDVEDHYEMQHWRFRQWCVKIWDQEWDYILSGSSSSYFDKELVYQKALTLPKEKCYCGIDGGGFASGSGHFMSRDVVKILMDEMTDQRIKFSDVYEGEILRRHGITVTPGAKRYDFNHVNDKLISCYHYRCKSNTLDRMQDVTAMNKVHRYLHK